MQPAEKLGKVAIVLSLYNGELHLREQLQSIEQQTFNGWRLVLRDDGSTDASKKQAEDFAKRFPDQITILKTSGGNLGAVASFSQLVQQAGAEYVLFCDQDDVWLPDKIEKTLAVMRAGEKQYGADTPLLVHTDLRVVDGRLRPLAASFWKYRQMNPRAGARLHRLLAQNVVTGCTVMINRSLAALATPIPPTAAMHDWWLAQVATLFGQILHLNEVTLLYRQHQNNSVGANPWGVKRMVRQAQHPQAVQAGILSGIRQAQGLLDRYRDRMQPEQIALVEDYVSLPHQSKVARLYTLISRRFCKHGLIRTLGFMANVVALERKRDQPPFLP